MLRQCGRYGQSEVVSNSRNEIHQTRDPSVSRATKFTKPGTHLLAEPCAHLGTTSLTVILLLLGGVKFVLCVMPLGYLLEALRFRALRGKCQRSNDKLQPAHRFHSMGASKERRMIQRASSVRAPIPVSSDCLEYMRPRLLLALPHLAVSNAFHRGREINESRPEPLCAPYA